MRALASFVFSGQSHNYRDYGIESSFLCTVNLMHDAPYTCKDVIKVMSLDEKVLFVRIRPPCTIHCTCHCLFADGVKAVDVHSKLHNSSACK